MVRTIYPVVFFGDPMLMAEIGMDTEGRTIAPAMLNEGVTTKPETPSVHVPIIEDVEENQEDSEETGDPKDFVTPSATQQPNPMHPSMSGSSENPATVDSENQSQSI